jgi:hypothetical protein
MKRVSVGLLTLGTMITGLSALAEPGRTEPGTEPMGTRQGAGLLQTQPLSVSQPSVVLVGTSSSAAPYTKDNLNSISASIQSRPAGSRAGSGLPSFIPRGLEAGPPPSTAINPIDFFKVQAPDRGVRFRLSESP